ncbi:MAG: sugar phosphate isomerase/epimerase [Asgard group archaeon]|nr:sugar phosphate isomerase/epimerase [Asgard group archaeon]
MQFGASYVLDKLLLTDLVTAKKIGFNFVEFYISDYWNDISELELQLIAIREILDSYDLFCIIHLSHLNSQLLLDSDLWTNYVDKLTEQIKIVGKLGITNKIIFHGVFGRTEDPVEMSSNEIFNIKLKAINEWYNEAQKNKMQFLLENTDESVKDLANVFKKQSDIRFTFDIGHANIIFPSKKTKKPEDKISAMLLTFKDKLSHIHIHDNFGGTNESADLHLPIGSGRIDFKKFFELLVKMNYKETITLEIYNPSFHSIYLETSFKIIQKIISDYEDSIKLRNI